MKEPRPIPKKEKTVQQNFRFTPMTVAQLEEIAKKYGIPKAVVLEQFIEDCHQKFVYKK